MPTFYNPNNPGGLSFPFPAEGELFLSIADVVDKYVYRVQNGRVVAYPLSSRLQQSLGLPPVSVPSNLSSYNPGDVRSVYGDVSVLRDASAFRVNAPQPTADITVPTDPTLQRYLGQAQAAGVPLADLNIATGQAKPTFVSAAPSSAAMGGVTGGVSPAPIGLNPAITSSPSNVEFKSTDAYKALSADEKSFVDMAFQLIAVGGEDEARYFANAIKQAKAIADPYFKAQLSLAQAEIGGKVAELNFDFDTKRELLERTQKQLLEDVSSQKQFLTLEQQSDLARLARDYDQDILQIRDVAAERGLTFATGRVSREGAEQQRGLAFADVIESSKRKFNFQVKELELKASRGDIAAQKQLEAMTGQRRFGLASAGRLAEAQIGTANLPAIEGFAPVGGVLGEVEEKKRKSIISDIGGLVSLQRGFL